MALGRRGFRPQGYIDIKAVAAKLGLSTSSSYALIRENDDFPKVRTFGSQATCWREDEIDAWIVKRIEEAENEARSDDPSGARRPARARAAKASKAALAAKAEAEMEPYMKFVNGFIAERRSAQKAQAA